MAEKYDGESIKVLEGLEGVRQKYDLVELSRKIKKRGDILILSKELKIKKSSLKHAIEEARILSFFPNIHKSKANALSRLKTDRELALFSKEYDVYRISARKLYKLVQKWNLDAQKNPLMFLSQKEHDLIMGSLLGDSSIRRRDKYSCFRFTHSIKQKEYAEYKKDILKEFEISEFREVRRKIGDNFIHAIDFATNTHPIFNYYRNLFYKNFKKTITQEIINQLTPESLAIWVCDDGSYSTKQGYIILCTNAYSLEEHNLMKQFFNEKFGLKPTIGFRDGKYYYLRFKQEDSKKLIQIIKPFIPKGMNYKIGGEND